MKLAGVVVLYNPDINVEDNIRSYLDSVDVVYAVDNSPSDNSERFSNDKIVYISNGENRGIAYALNAGARKAIADGYDWLLTMDQDSSFSDDGIEKMKEFIIDCRENKNEYNYQKIGLITPFHRTIFNENENPQGIDSPAVVMTSGNIINLKAYKEIGGFKDWMFIDAVDFDYCLNLRDHGYDIWRLTYIELKHNLGNVVFKNIGKKHMYSLNHSAMRRYYIVRNRHYFYDMYHERWPDFCNAEKARTSREAAKIFLCEKQKYKKLFAMLKGYIDYKRGVKGAKK
ncbi:MAG: glycosyltransferase family 2 protein [Clostridia bacterium]|nr:glycosyltransferase family 2 protein [Clostridia bacterium]